MGKEMEIVDLGEKPNLSGKFITGSVIDVDFKDPVRCRVNMREVITQKQSEEIRLKILRRKLP